MLGLNINNLTGIEDFAALEDLNVRGNNINTLDTSENLVLKFLNCNVNPLNSINISQNILLENLEMRVVHQLDNIDLSNNINLEILYLDDTWLDSLDVSNNISLKTLFIGGIGLTVLDISNNTLLEYLDVSGNSLSTLDVSNNPLLKELYCSNYGGFTNLMVSSLELNNNVNLELLYAENLFFIETLNLKNGNNPILTVSMPCEFEGVPCELTELDCVKVDDEVAATNHEPPYDSWFIDAVFVYSEDCILGISTQEDSDFSIHPNPTKDKLYITATNTTENLTLKIFNIEGKLLSTQTLEVANQTSIAISQLVSGIYFLNIEDERGNTATKKFIKE